MTALAMSRDLPFAPTWLVMPLALVTLILLIVHVLGVLKSDMPASRRRIRIANGALMMICTPVAAYALGIAVPAQARVFAFAWVVLTGLVVVILFLAVMDMFNTWRLAMTERRDVAADVLTRLPRRGSDSTENAAT